MQPTACPEPAEGARAEGRSGSRQAPAGRKTSSHAHAKAAPFQNKIKTRVFSASCRVVARSLKVRLARSGRAIVSRQTRSAPASLNLYWLTDSGSHVIFLDRLSRVRARHEHVNRGHHEQSKEGSDNHAANQHDSDAVASARSRP